MEMATMHPWGRRLTDAVRARIAAGELEGACALARDGDGETRSLASEYLLMTRGLGITIRVLLGQLEAACGGVATDAPMRAALAELLGRFRDDLSGSVADASQPGAIALLAGQARAALEARQQRFEAAQSALAAAAIEALDAGDGARASALLDDKEQRSYLPYHDRLVRFMADSFGFVLRHLGADALLRFHLDTAEGQRAGFDKWERMSAAEFARVSVFLLKQHMGEVTVREDDTAFTITQSPCGSGGRLRTGGAYSGAGALPFVSEAGQLTFGEPALPVYCTHCAIWNGVATLHWYGRAHWIFTEPARADGGCVLRIPKRRDGTPPEYAARLGVRIPSVEPRGEQT